MTNPQDSSVTVEPKWCAPGDDQHDRWILRFNDADMREAIFDNEAEARERWTSMCGPSGTWNGYLFRLAARPSEAAPQVSGGMVERAQRAICEEIARQTGRRWPVWTGSASLVDAELSLEDLARAVVAALNLSTESSHDGA